jgi:predicted ATPase
MLAELRAGEFIYEQPSATGVEYVFKHALTQEVAYNSLLIEHRKQLHARAGQGLESIFAGQLDDHLTQLAHHYSHSDNVDKAVEYLGRAGHQALQRSAYADAISSLGEAIGLLQKLPDSPDRIQRELPLQLAMGSAQFATKGFAAPEAERAFIRARDMCEQLGDPPELFPASFGLWAVYYLRGELPVAYTYAEQLMRRAEISQDSALLIPAHIALGDTLSSRGNPVLAMEHLDLALSLYDPERHLHLAVFDGDARINPLSYSAVTLWALGYPDQALKRIDEALHVANTVARPHDLAFVEFFAGRLLQERRDARATRETAERLIALSHEHGFSFWLAQATIELGAAMAEEGRREEGIAQMLEGFALLRAAGPRLQYLCLLAKACIETDRLDDGLSALTEALATAEKHEWCDHETEMHRLKGELLLKQADSNATEARSCFERAIEIAREQRAKSWELRATMSLARLLASQGRREEARTMLADIYGWFTEGFDTADLKDAKALLDDLRG